MDIFDLLERGALAHKGIDRIGTYNEMIRKIEDDEIPINEMRILLSSLYKALNEDSKNRIELLIHDINENGIDENIQTYGLDDYSVASIVADEMNKS